MSAVCNDSCFPRSSTDFSEVADVIAIGAISAVSFCGGPVIPYRMGRIDATEAGRFGVPKRLEFLI